MNGLQGLHLVILLFEILFCKKISMYLRNIACRHHHVNFGFEDLSIELFDEKSMLAKALYFFND
jgi:hypothetical protein